MGEEPRIETKADSQVLLTQSMILTFLSVDTKLFPFANEISITGLCLWYNCFLAVLSLKLRPRVTTLSSFSDCSITWLSRDTSSHFHVHYHCLMSNITCLVTFFVPDDAPPPWTLGWTSSTLPNLSSYLPYKALAVKHQWRGEWRGDEASISDLSVDSFSLYPDSLDPQVIHVVILTTWWLP